MSELKATGIAEQSIRILKGTPPFMACSPIRRISRPYIPIRPMYRVIQREKPRIPVLRGMRIVVKSEISPGFAVPVQLKIKPRAIELMGMRRWGSAVPYPEADRCDTGPTGAEAQRITVHVDFSVVKVEPLTKASQGILVVQSQGTIPVWGKRSHHLPNGYSDC
jgi:hypothetical protein